MKDNDIKKNELNKLLAPKIQSKSNKKLPSYRWASSAMSAMLTGWFVYEPIITGLGVNRDGFNDEIIAISSAVAVAVISGASNAINYACNTPQSYKQKIHIGTGAGVLSGSTLTIALGALLDATVTGGLTALTASLLSVGGAASGGLLGSLITKLKAKKECINGHIGKCCERICIECGFIYMPLKKWEKIITLKEAKPIKGDRLDWIDIVSIFHYRNLNYAESVKVYEEYCSEWDIRSIVTAETPTIGRNKFFNWLENNENNLSQYRHVKPSSKLWDIAERAVRSECDPDQKIPISNVQRKY